LSTRIGASTIVDASNRMCHVIIELILVRHDFHRAPAEHEAWTDQHGISNLARDLLGFGNGSGNAIRRLLKAQL